MKKKLSALAVKESKVVNKINTYENKYIMREKVKEWAKHSENLLERVKKMA